MNAKRLALGWVFFLAGAVLLSPLFISKSAYDMNFSHALEAPSFSHLFGTDSLGRDLLSRVLLGSSVSLGVSLCAVFLALAVGTWIGAVAAYKGGLWDKTLMAFVDTMLCFPVFFLMLSVLAVLGPNVWSIPCVIGLTSWMGVARLVRSEVLSIKEREFILAARVMRARSFWIITRHLIPNVRERVLVSGILGISAAILAEAGLSFLGIGIQPPAPSWGNILMDAKATLGAAWWLLFFPGAMIFLTVLSMNILGEHWTQNEKNHSSD